MNFLQKIEMKKFDDNLVTLRRNPHLFYKIIRNYFRIFFGESVLGAVELAVTYNCNISCEFCSSKDLYQSNKRYLNLQEIKAIIEDLVKLGTLVINITGGEPTLREDLYEIISSIKRKRILATILTNGHLLTKERISRLKELSLDAVQISLNYGNNSFHNKEQKVALEKTFLGIENAKSEGLRVIISSIITNENINDGRLNEIIEFTKGINTVLNLIVPCTVGGWSGSCEKLLSQSSWNKFQDLCKRKGIRTDIHSNYFGNLCPAGTERIYISAYGDVLPCDFIHISFGNLKDDSLIDILKRMSNFKPIKNKKTPCLAGHDSEFIEKYLTHLPDKNPPPSYRNFQSGKISDN